MKSVYLTDYLRKSEEFRIFREAYDSKKILADLTPLKTDELLDRIRIVVGKRGEVESHEMNAKIKAFTSFKAAVLPVLQKIKKVARDLAQSRENQIAQYSTVAKLLDEFESK
jgi:hypothetical protein